jgi:hypothetical protein
MYGARFAKVFNDLRTLRGQLKILLEQSPPTMPNGGFCEHYHFRYGVVLTCEGQFVTSPPSVL